MSEQCDVTHRIIRLFYIHQCGVSQSRREHASCNSLLFYSGMILLGTELEDENLLTFTPDSGFNGLVSHVYVWNRALDPLTEITLMADDRDNLVQTGSLIVDWAYYVTERGVSVLQLACPRML